MSERMESRRTGFTLIELLVVIMIVGVLFAVALPMFENASKKDTRQAAQQLVNTLRLARQHAISTRQWTLVVFPNANKKAKYTADVNESKSLNLDKCLRSYAVLAVTNNMDGKYKFNSKQRDPKAEDMEFEFLSEWKTLPSGIYFDDDTSLTDNWAFKYEDSNKRGFKGEFTFPWNPEEPNNKSKQVPMSAVLFKPNGRAFIMCDGSPDDKGNYWQDVDNRLYVTSAKIYEPDANGGSLDEGHPLPGGTNTIVLIQNKTGQMKLLDEGQLYDED